MEFDRPGERSPENDCSRWVTFQSSSESSLDKKYVTAGFKPFSIKSGCQRKPGKMLKMSTEGGQQN